VILCSPTPLSMIKAALLAQLHNDLPCIKGEQESLGLFMFTNEYNADASLLPSLIVEVQHFCGLDANWLLDKPGKKLTQLIRNNLRYQSTDRTVVIFAALEQALRYGHAFCFGGIGDISKLFIERSKAVSHEVHRVSAFIRFSPAPDNTWVTQPKLFHRTADLILRKFSLRDPDARLIMILDNQALILENQKLLVQPAAEFLHYLPCGDTLMSKTWETYYQAQSMAACKNSYLAQTAIPKKYRTWLSEVIL